MRLFHFIYLTRKNWFHGQTKEQRGVGESPINEQQLIKKPESLYTIYLNSARPVYDDWISPNVHFLRGYWPAWALMIQVFKSNNLLVQAEFIKSLHPRM